MNMKFDFSLKNKSVSFNGTWIHKTIEILIDANND